MFTTDIEEETSHALAGLKSGTLWPSVALLRKGEPNLAPKVQSANYINSNDCHMHLC